MNPRRFAFFVLALVWMLDARGPIVVLQAFAVMAGAEVLYLGCRWLARLPGQNEAERLRRRSEAEAAFLALESEPSSRTNRPRQVL